MVTKRYFEFAMQPGFGVGGGTWSAPSGLSPRYSSQLDRSLARYRADGLEPHFREVFP